MPVSDPAPGSSEPIAGIPIPVSALPVSPVRRMSLSAPGMQVLFRQCSDAATDYYPDFRPQLESGEKILGLEAWVSPVTDPPLEILFAEYAPDGVLLWLSGGVDGQRYEITAEVTTRLGSKAMQFLVDAAGTAAPWVIIVGQLTGGTVGFNDYLLTATPTSLAFPETPIGSVSAPHTVTVRNAGEQPLHVSEIAVSGPFAFTSTTRGDLGPGESFSLSISFIPVSQDFRTGALEISGTLALSIALSGTGI